MGAPLVTVLGSCRQYSAAHHFQVTCIQEGLTYPHYSKEILQAVRYLKSNTLRPEQTQACFRTGLLQKGPILDYEQMARAFRDTDVFLLEIASRLCYDWQGLVVHHIAVEPAYGFADAASVAIREQTDAEIESDVLEIRSLLSPRPMIVVAHITTRKSGKRYDLVRLLEAICARHGIIFFDPAVLLEAHPADKLYRPEPVLAHYTDIGHSIVSQEYKRLISGACSI